MAAFEAPPSVVASESPLSRRKSGSSRNPGSPRNRESSYAIARLLIPQSYHRPPRASGTGSAGTLPGRTGAEQTLGRNCAQPAPQPGRPSPVGAVLVAPVVLGGVHRPLARGRTGRRRRYPAGALQPERGRHQRGGAEQAGDRLR